VNDHKEEMTKEQMELNEVAMISCRGYNTHHAILGGANTRFSVPADAGCPKTSALVKYNRRTRFDTTDCVCKG
jgi:hypothetical protein